MHAAGLRSISSNTATYGTIRLARSARARTAGPPSLCPPVSRLRRARSVGTMLPRYPMAANHLRVGYADAFVPGGGAATGASARCAAHRSCCSTWSSRSPTAARDPIRWILSITSRRHPRHMSGRKATTGERVSAAIFSRACRRPWMRSCTGRRVTGRSPSSAFVRRSKRFSAGDFPKGRSCGASRRPISNRYFP
jgi:hypothetical protein